VTVTLRHFRIHVIVRLTLLVLTVVSGIALFAWSASIPSVILIGIAAVYQLFSLIRYVEKTNRDLARLLQSIRYSDFTQSFNSGDRGEAFSELSGAFRSVVDDFKAVRREKEESFQYLHTIMQHVGIGLISFKTSGEVSLINSAAKKLLRVPYLKNVEKLRSISETLTDALLTIGNSEKRLVKLTLDGELLDLSIYGTEFKIGGELYRLVSIQNIRSELEDVEVAAWQTLTRVLAHEIMNSVAPIASLATTADSLLEDIGKADATTDLEHLNDVRGAVSTIARRSEGLLNFVQAYRSVTRVPAPDKKRFRVTDLVRSVSDLMHPMTDELDVSFECSVDPDDLELFADREMIEQVLINLVKNASEAAKEGALVEGQNGERQVSDANVRLKAFVDGRGHTIIEVTDNGPGIPQDILEKVFVPFFTTKKEGSGIGLSLSREVMRRHGGSILVTSGTNGTTATLRF